MTDTHTYPVGLQRAAIVFTVMLSALMAVIDTSIVNVSLPTIGASLGASLSDMGWIATGYILANVTVMPLNGFLTATLGQKRFFLLAVGGFTLTSVLCGLARSIETLVAFRVLQGLFGGVLMPISQTVLYQTYPKSEHGKAMGMFGLGVIAGPAVGPTLGGYLTEHWGWPMIFNVNLPFGLLALFMASRSMSDSGPMAKPAGRFDAAGLTSLVVGLASLQYVLEKGQEDGWFDSHMILGLTITCVVALCFFIWHELRTPNPVVDLRILKDRTFAAGSIIGMITGFGLYGMNIVLPLFFAAVLHFNAVDTGFALMPGALATAVSMPLAGRVADRFDPRLVIAVGFAMFLYFLADLSSINVNTGYWEVFWPQLIRGFGLGLLFVPLSAATMSGISREKQAAASGLNNLLRQLGGSFGIAILTTILSHSQTVYYGHLIADINPYNPIATQRLQLYEAAMRAKGMAASVAHQQSLTFLAGAVRVQSAILAYIDLFRVTTIIFLVSIVPLFFLKRHSSVRPANGDGPSVSLDH